jgi:hypothetical protein
MTMVCHGGVELGTELHQFVLGRRVTDDAKDGCLGPSLGGSGPQLRSTQSLADAMAASCCVCNSTTTYSGYFFTGL